MKVRCWFCGLIKEVDERRIELEPHAFMGVIEGNNIVGDDGYCDAWDRSRLFIPGDGRLAPVFGMAAVKTRPTSDEVNHVHATLAEWQKGKQ